MKKENKPLHQVNWYADKYQSIVVWRNWLFLITLLCLGAVIFMAIASRELIPMKSVEPFVVQIDDRSGATEIVQGQSLKEYSANEALIRYFAIQYINSREAYNYHTFVEDRDKVLLMSERDVSRIYRDEISADNPKNPVNVYGATTEKRLYTKNFTFLYKNTSLGESQVQAVMIVQEVSTSKNPSQYVLTVTLTCVFDPQFVQSDEDRVINPLGFKVVAYRADKDIAKLSTEN
jgi:type IV secretion system protein VirB8